MLLRNYQAQLVSDVRQQIKTGATRILVQLSCGGGKTAIASYILKNTIANGYAAIAMTHRFELCSQFSKTLTRFNVPHGMIQSGVKMDLSLPMQVASIGTLKNRLEKTVIPKILVVDEAAHIAAKSWSEIADYYHSRGTIVIGLTACPTRLSGESLSDCFDVMVQGPTVKELTDMKFLCGYKYLAPPQVMELDGISTVCGDYAKGELFQVVAKSQITGDAIQHYKTFLSGKRAIAFCVSIEHAKMVAMQFREAGVPAEAVDGGTNKNDRAAAMKRFERGETLVLVNCELYGEGVDVPSCEGVIMLRPTQSLSLFIQMSGRALRPDPNNPDKVSVILDHCGNVYRHDLPSADRIWDLGAEKPKRKKSDPSTVSIKCCPMCYSVMRPMPVCEMCGFVFPVEVRELRQTPGELAEVTKIEKKAKRCEVGQCRTIAELKAIAKERGYKSGWIWQMAKAKGIKA